jgi:hypothetical protein
MATACTARVVLEGHRDPLVELLQRRLRHSTALHYRDAETDRLFERCSRLVDVFLDSLDEGPTRLAQHLRNIALERIHEGVSLPEIQLVLHILENECWRICDEEIEPRAAVVAGLARVSGVIGHAKDALAQVYLESATKTRKQLLALNPQLDEVAKGTDTAILAE